MIVLVTGYSGFIGRNLMVRLRNVQDLEILAFGRHNSGDELAQALKRADVIFHLAGINRPQDPVEYELGNTGLTKDICSILREQHRSPKIVMSSSIQAALDNPYGTSKRMAELELQAFATDTGADVRVYRLPNVFGKWCRPNYNSFVATVCYNIANGLPIQISDPNREIELVHIDDVVEAFIQELSDQERQSPLRHIPSFRVTLGELVAMVRAFHDMQSNLRIPDLSSRFSQQLYGTYLTYVPKQGRQYAPESREDDRGWLAEILKSEQCGQIFVSRTKPGITRGNHYHHTKAEKFIVVEGEALIRMRQIESDQVVEYRVTGARLEIVDIPPGHTHSIQNIGSGEMVVVFWASEIFNADRPDTVFLPVSNRVGG